MPWCYFNINKMRKSFCLDSVSSFRDINQSPLNRSTSKNLWSFSKDNRFQKEKVYCDRIYEVGGMRPSKYGVSIGKGTKSDFTKDRTASPGASKYFRSSFFDYNKEHQKGWSLAVGREVPDRSKARKPRTRDTSSWSRSRCQGPGPTTIVKPNGASGTR